MEKYAALCEISPLLFSDIPLKFRLLNFYLSNLNSLSFTDKDMSELFGCTTKQLWNARSSLIREGLVSMVDKGNGYHYYKAICQSDTRGSLIKLNKMLASLGVKDVYYSRDEFNQGKAEEFLSAVPTLYLVDLGHAQINNWWELFPQLIDVNNESMIPFWKQISSDPYGLGKKFSAVYGNESDSLWLTSFFLTFNFKMRSFNIDSIGNIFAYVRTMMQNFDLKVEKTTVLNLINLQKIVADRSKETFGDLILRLNPTTTQEKDEYGTDVDAVIMSDRKKEYERDQLESTDYEIEIEVVESKPIVEKSSEDFDFSFLNNL